MVFRALRQAYVTIFFFFCKEVNQLVYVGVAPGGSQVYQVTSLLFKFASFSRGQC